MRERERQNSRKKWNKFKEIKWEKGNVDVSNILHINTHKFHLLLNSLFIRNINEYKTKLLMDEVQK